MKKYLLSGNKSQTCLKLQRPIGETVHSEVCSRSRVQNSLAAAAEAGWQEGVQNQGVAFRCLGLRSAVSNLRGSTFESVLWVQNPDRTAFCYSQESRA